MNESPFFLEPLFHVGPVPITGVVTTTWGIVIALTLFSLYVRRHLARDPSRLQAFVEGTVGAIADQIAAVTDRDPRPFLPLLGTLFIFLIVANLLAIVPGVAPPTAHLETPAALGIVVFLAVHVFGIREQGLRNYLGAYLRPNPLFLPINIVSEISRTFSLIVRLFGNITSHHLILGLVIGLAGLFVPIPLMALEIIIGLVQAYIFAILATVFVGAAVRGEKT